MVYQAKQNHYLVAPPNAKPPPAAGAPMVVDPKLKLDILLIVPVFSLGYCLMFQARSNGELLLMLAS